jgi:hypothetical protein
MPRGMATPRMTRQALLEAFEVDEGAEEGRDVTLALAHDRLDKVAEGRELVTLLGGVGRGPGGCGRRMGRSGRVAATDGFVGLVADVACVRSRLVKLAREKRASNVPIILLVNGDAMRRRTRSSWMCLGTSEPECRRGMAGGGRVASSRSGERVSGKRNVKPGLFGIRQEVGRN